MFKTKNGGDVYKYWPCKLLIFLVLCECLIMLICQFAEKDALLYFNLKRLNLVMYLPDTRNYTNTKSSPAPKVFGGSGEEEEGSRNTAENLTWLTNNPIYQQFNVKELRRKKRVTVLIIVSSAPRRVDRRQAIRETWWAECKEINKVSLSVLLFSY